MRRVRRRRQHCFPFQKSIKSQLSDRAGFWLGHCFPFQKSIKSQPGAAHLALRLTVSHFKRASNHNTSVGALLLALLFPISKEHQITTANADLSRAYDCFPFQKSIKSQPACSAQFVRLTVSHFKRASNHNWKASPWRARSTVSHFKRASNHNHCPLSLENLLTVSHFKRASNHNLVAFGPNRVATVSHFKRASNHNLAGAETVARELFPISKEHQITTLLALKLSPVNCFPFQKSIKSQRTQNHPRQLRHCFPFQKSIKSQPWRPS